MRACGRFSRRTSLIACLTIAAASLNHAAVNAADDGSFPEASQVGGEVFPEGLKIGDKFPEKVQLYDEQGKAVELQSVLGNKRTLLVFFISAAPASVEELVKIDKMAGQGHNDTQIIFANADTVGVALLGGKPSAIPETVRTIKLIKQEHKLSHPIFVAPNDVFDPHGLSNRLGFRGLPTSYLLDADGKVEKRFVGAREWKSGDI
jgi:hypothetical protein